MKILAAAFLAASIASSCSSVVLTPESLDATDVPLEERTADLALWSAAVELANEFLASPYRHTLPLGHFDLAPSGMQYVTERGTWPIEVRCTSYGDMVVSMGLPARRARRGGARAGERPLKRSRA